MAFSAFFQMLAANSSPALLPAFAVTKDFRSKPLFARRRGCFGLIYAKRAVTLTESPLFLTLFYHEDTILSTRYLLKYTHTVSWQRVKGADSVMDKRKSAFFHKGELQ